MIKQVIFDVGNVIVRWSPIEIIRLTFGPDVAHEALARTVFLSDTWYQLNQGRLTESQAGEAYQAQLGWSPADCARFFYYVKHSQIPIYGTLALMKQLKQAGYPLYGLTDNVHEIVHHLKANHDFWPLFEDVVVSAEEDCLKPQPDIYRILLSRNQLEAAECVFIDDVAGNVQGAQAVGISGIQFEHAAQCQAALKALGLSF